MAKDFDPNAIIARLVGSPLASGGGKFCSAMMVLGVIGILLAVIFESSAIRLAAWGAIWTGWNVFWGIGILQGTRMTYIVYRESQPTV